MFYLLIYYIEIILILKLIDICILTNILIAKKHKILSAIIYYIFIISILNLYLADFF